MPRGTAVVVAVGNVAVAAVVEACCRQNAANISVWGRRKHPPCGGRRNVEVSPSSLIGWPIECQKCDDVAVIVLTS